jgi:hypothetical protein
MNTFKELTARKRKRFICRYAVFGRIGWSQAPPAFDLSLPRAASRWGKAPPRAHHGIEAKWDRRTKGTLARGRFAGNNHQTPGNEIPLAARTRPLPDGYPEEKESGGLYDMTQTPPWIHSRIPFLR